MTVDVVLAVLAVALVIVGGRVRTGASSATTWLALPEEAPDRTDDQRRTRQQVAGVVLEVAAVVCLAGAVTAATIRHREDVDVSEMAVSIVALALVSLVVAAGRRRAATSGDHRGRDGDG